MNAKICDRCGKTFVPNNKELNAHRCRVADTEAHLRYFDMCPDCLSEIDAFMNKFRTPGFDYNPQPKKYRGKKFSKPYTPRYGFSASRTESTETTRDLSLKPRYYKPAHEEAIDIEAYESQIRREEDPE